MRPLVCLVSGGGTVADLPARVTVAARAGVHLVQVREPQLEADALLDLVLRCLAAVRGTRCRVVVNDRLDVALAARAHGVHLRGDGPPAARVRPHVPDGFLIGRSIHDAAEAADSAAGGNLDYLFFGNVFPSGSKPGKAGAGLPALAAVAGSVRLPVLAIGGITAATVASIARTGAAGFAAIGLFAAPPLDELAAAIETAAYRFDTPIARSLT